MSLALHISLLQATHQGYVRASQLLSSSSWQSYSAAPAHEAASRAFAACLQAAAKDGDNSFADYATLVRRRGFSLGQAYWRRSTFDATETVGLVLLLTLLLLLPLMKDWVGLGGSLPLISEGIIFWCCS